MSSFGFDIGSIVSLALKYLIIGLAVAVSAFYIPKGGKMRVEEIVMIAVSAAASVAVLDMFVPSAGAAFRTGAGFGIGANLVGFPK